MNAQRESAVLYTLPPTVTDVLVNCVNDPHWQRAAARLHYLRYSYSLAPLVVNNIHDYDRHDPLDTPWEPLNDFYESKERSEWAGEYFHLRQTMLLHTLAELEATEEVAHHLRWVQLEWANMANEDARANLHRTNRLLKFATDRIESAMNLSKTNLEEVTMQELNLWENWKQSWDTIENGNGWMGLNHRRKYLRVNRIHEEEYITTALQLTGVKDYLADRVARVWKLSGDVIEETEDVEKFRPHVKYSRNVFKQVEESTMEAVRAVVTSFSMPWKTLQVSE